jgi:hypothetical protein
VANQELESMEGSALFKVEEKPTNSNSVRRAGKVGAPATQDSFPHYGKKEERKTRKPLDDGDDLDYLEPYKGITWDDLALRRERW